MAKTQKKSQTSQKKDWFGENTGIIDTAKNSPQQTDLISFIQDIGQKAKKKYGNDYNKINAKITNALSPDAIKVPAAANPI